MFSFEEDANFVQDREDLIAVLRMRFGNLPAGVIDGIYKINDMNTLERLILVAANAPELKIFLEEMKEGTGSFKILGERFNPMNSLNKEGGLVEKNKK
ncbi:hypothetical protein F3157_21420 [Virgibacillus dakarensis]|uniref:Uncharacterized protein n=1 Tax=Lentibacillus populi TaxID=1827502 RepID=A0A9W5X7K8_9BACI|nr:MULTISPECIES: hypothetical protein [Bacillaceae]MBT2214903.1 hypothetical protein [Virgibacillus dakarensis]MTW88155.1 hypothetical protein [Virgibacillus dakarensis]GGB60617.1 hypothetical protein GCM10011409_42440 [Lentibacillus populi]